MPDSRAKTNGGQSMPDMKYSPTYRRITCPMCKREQPYIKVPLTEGLIWQCANSKEDCPCFAVCENGKLTFFRGYRNSELKKN